MLLFLMISWTGITYGEQSSNTTLMKKDVENMAISSLLASFKEASAESFTFGSDKLFLKYVNLFFEVF